MRELHGTWAWILQMMSAFDPKRTLDLIGIRGGWRSRQNSNNVDCPSLGRIGGRYGDATEVAPVWRLFREL